MLQRFGLNALIWFFAVVSLGHRQLSRSRSIVPVCVLALSATCNIHAQQAQPTNDTAAKAAKPTACLSSGDGYLRARLAGAVRKELAWGNEGTECTGAVRPTDGGIRMRFSRPDDDDGQPELARGRLVLVFGIAGLREGRAAKNLPVNVTVIREGRGEFYSTQGDDKCTLDQVTQQPIVGGPRRSRSYRIIARGFCTEPARAVRGKGVVLLSRFDYSGRVDFESEATEDDAALAAGAR
jgi:hypothetical protein